MKKTIITILQALAFMLIGGSIYYTAGVNKGSKDATIAIKSYNRDLDTNRNIEYEHWCDSIRIADPNYYLDTITESYDYNQYIEEHGQWWDN